MNSAPTLLPPQFHFDRFLFAQKMLRINEDYQVFNDRGMPVLFVQRRSHILQNLLAGVVFLVVAAALLAGTFGLVEMINGQPAKVAIGIVGGVVALAAAITVAILLAPKRHIEFYADQARTQLLMRIYQDQKVALLTATYTAADAHDQLLGYYSKNNLTNFFRREWKVFGPDGELVFLGMEDSIARAVLRRLIGPAMGLLRLNFILVLPGFSDVLGQFNREFTLLDKYVLDLTPDRERKIDRRLALGLAVLFDTGERR